MLYLELGYNEVFSYLVLDKPPAGMVKSGLLRPQTPGPGRGASSRANLEAQGT